VVGCFHGAAKDGRASHEPAMSVRSSDLGWNRGLLNALSDRGAENPMSKYLNDLIKTLEAEAHEHQAPRQPAASFVVTLVTAAF